MITKVESKNRDGVPITNNAKILGIIVDIQVDAYEKNKKSLSKNMTDDLMRLFGKNTNSFLGEFRHKIWTLKFKDLQFNIFCSKRGTTIEICNYDYEQIRIGERESDIIEFIKELYKIIQ